MLAKWLDKTTEFTSKILGSTEKPLGSGFFPKIIEKMYFQRLKT
jgi:hypothetical protein